MRCLLFIKFVWELEMQRCPVFSNTGGKSSRRWIFWCREVNVQHQFLLLNGRWNVEERFFESRYLPSYSNIAKIRSNFWIFWKIVHTFLISSIERWPSVDIPTACGWTFTINITRRAMNRSLISWSEARSFRPVWYHPIIRSLAIQNFISRLVNQENR